MRSIARTRGSDLCLRKLHASATRAAGAVPLASSIPEYRSLFHKLLPTDSPRRVGFVPTMGALHEGHAELVKQARRENDMVVVSIFVNPTQFGDASDLTNYPRTMEADLQLLEALGADLVFAPTPEIMYPTGFSTYLDMSHYDGLAEGAGRPGHFRGVATVCVKLFNIVGATKAYFGQKDAMQCMVIRKVVEDLNLPLEVVVVPTIRAEDGLALSSRNARLTEAERAASPVIYRAISSGTRLWESALAGGASSMPRQEIEAEIRRVLAEDSLLGEVQYVSIACKNTMQEIDTIKASKGAVISLAVQLGAVRLIDNAVI